MTDETELTSGEKPPRVEGGKWAPGVSGNPAGRSKAHGRLRDLARAQTEPAIATLVEVMLDKQAPHAARVSAANHVLDRGWGRPEQSVAVSGDPDAPLLIQKIERVLVSANAADRDG